MSLNKAFLFYLHLYLFEDLQNRVLQPLIETPAIVDLLH